MRQGQGGIVAVFIRIVAAATINFGYPSVRLLIEGGSYSRAATINFVRARAPLRYYYIISISAGRARAAPASRPTIRARTIERTDCKQV